MSIEIPSDHNIIKFDRRIKQLSQHAVDSGMKLEGSNYVSIIDGGHTTLIDQCYFFELHIPKFIELSLCLEIDLYICRNQQL